jgi:hypothetical protein
MDFVVGLGNVLTMRPGPEDGSPKISWGDTFFFYSADGHTPSAAQPFATIVTKDYPGDAASHLDRPGAFRVNMSAGLVEFTRWTGRTPSEISDEEVDYARDDTVLPHPVYGTAGWLSVTNPGPHAGAAMYDLLHLAHARARTRHERNETRAQGVSRASEPGSET